AGLRWIGCGFELTVADGRPRRLRTSGSGGAAGADFTCVCLHGGTHGERSSLPSLASHRAQDISVPTENYIRAGGYATIGYSGRRDDRRFEAARRIARRSVQIACGSRSRDGISPPAASRSEEHTSEL